MADSYTAKRECENWGDKFPQFLQAEILQVKGVPALRDCHSYATGRECEGALAAQTGVLCAARCWRSLPYHGRRLRQPDGWCRRRWPEWRRRLHRCCRDLPSSCRLCRRLLLPPLLHLAMQGLCQPSSSQLKSGKALLSFPEPRASSSPYAISSCPTSSKHWSSSILLHSLRWIQGMTCWLQSNGQWSELATRLAWRPTGEQSHRRSRRGAVVSPASIPSSERCAPRSQLQCNNLVAAWQQSQR